VVIRCFVKISSGHTAYGPYALQLHHWTYLPTYTYMYLPTYSSTLPPSIHPYVMFYASIHISIHHPPA